MGKQFVSMSHQHIEFIEQQQLFFVATAAAQGKVNVSPKGMDSFRVLNSQQVLWLNLTGSGNETAAHVQQLPRMTVMFCAFQGKPLILRLYGQATAIHRADEAWQDYISMFPAQAGARQIFLLEIEMVQGSCGLSVPFFDFVGPRDELSSWAEKQGERGIEQYWAKKNQRSLDGVATHIVNLSKPAT
ncbi:MULTISPECIES: pyridoxamine 5'-phosphate oxidase family protein [unclassified Agarivorans]|uniref:pyridoxamine 5'-phosphate oxidase family protein n=1 Tax=unclassified Agarivorans TaxID=2636026 RepID=UPI003D7E499E